ncbi:hypothetical protein CRUP_036583, partial [Coryphaenoides rupestris]
DHCFYHGDVRGHPDSWVALSMCSGVSDTYYLEPISGQGPLRHWLSRAEDLPLRGGTCGHGHKVGFPGQLSRLLRPPPHHRSRLNALFAYATTGGVIFKGTTIGMAPLEGMCSLENSGGINVRESWGTTKYMELYIVADNTLFTQQNKDYHKTKLRIMEIANYVDKWRQKLKARKKHDNAQLLTGVIFKGTTIGMAPLEGMCSLENSGGINVDHSDLPIGAAATMAHEIGHNFGMSHDHSGCCVEATAEEGGCVMAAATGHPFPRVFSHCSKRDLDSYFQKGGGMCLFNMPNMKDLVGGKRCGNGFECTNNCCNANNCTLKEEAQCAHGVCCESCKLKQAGTMCRGPAGACDLPEYCTGASAYCPANVYLLDGSACQYDAAYCYNGMCLTHQQQCVQLWGYGARPAHDACFEDVNAAGNAFGNCGKDGLGNYMNDAKCGKIQCHSAAKKPKGTNAVSIDTTIKTDGREVKCRGTYVYSTQDGQGDLPDPGLVMTGTKCGEGKVCNSNGNCHCNRGWAPPFCDKSGLGGSVDSGPVQYDSQVGLVAGLLLAFLVLLPSALGAFYCLKVKSSYYHRWLSQREKNHNKELLPLRPTPPAAPSGGGGGGSTTQPVNVVRPLRPSASPAAPAGGARGPKRPATAARPTPPPKSPASPQRLTPPRKPLPLNPTRSPVFVSEPQSRRPAFPPQRPLPLSPARAPAANVSPARAGPPVRAGPPTRPGPPARPSNGLLTRARSQTKLCLISVPKMTSSFVEAHHQDHHPRHHHQHHHILRCLLHRAHRGVRGGRW